MIIQQYRFLSLALQIEEDQHRRAKLCKALRILEGQLPNVTLESITDERDCAPERNHAPANPADRPPPCEGNR